MEVEKLKIMKKKKKKYAPHEHSLGDTCESQQGDFQGVGHEGKGWGGEGIDGEGRRTFTGGH